MFYGTLGYKKYAFTLTENWYMNYKLPLNFNTDYKYLLYLAQWTNLNSETQNTIYVLVPLKRKKKKLSYYYVRGRRPWGQSSLDAPTAWASVVKKDC